MLRGKYVWIIGASAGIGAALAKKLAQQGAMVAISARDEAALATLKGELPGVGHQSLPLDVTHSELLNEAVNQLRSLWPRIDIVIYNAGTYTPMGVDSFKLAAIETMVSVNLRGAFYLLDAMLPQWAAQGKGHLALVGSVAGYRGLPNALGYGASKAALINLAESLKTELAPKNVKVQLVSPGFVKTRLTDMNEFPMPFIITAEQAADAFIAGLQGSGFEITFPKRFTAIMKLLRALPYGLYFLIAKKLR